MVSFAGAASWQDPGADGPPGHGRGVLVISQDTVTFALHGGVRTFTHSGAKIALTRTPLAAVAVLEDGHTRVRVIVTGLSGRKLARTLSQAGRLA